MSASSSSETASYQKARRTCLTVGLLGLPAGAIISGLYPNFLVYPDSTWTGFPWPAALAAKIVVRANNWPWVILTAAIVVSEIVQLKFDKRAWVLAAALGLLVGSLAVRAIR